MFAVHNQKWKPFLSNSKTTFIWRVSKASKTDVSESIGVWHNVFFSDGTKLNKEVFLGRACEYLPALSSSSIPRSISNQKSRFKSWSCSHWGEVHGSPLSGLSSVSLWGTSSKMTPHNTEKYIASHCMFTVFMMNYLNYTDQEMQDLKKLQKLISVS